MATSHRAPIVRQDMRTLLLHRLDGRSLQALLMIAAVTATVSQLASMSGFLQPPDLYWRDIVQDWLWARALRDGLDPYTPTPVLALTYLGDCCSVHLSHPSPHPPLAGILILPLSWLDVAPASVVWAGVELVFLGLAISRLTQQPWVRVVAITGALLGWHALRTEIVHGQFTTLQLLLLALALNQLTGPRSSGDGMAQGPNHPPTLPLLNTRQLRAGALIGLAIAIKPILWPLAILFIARRQPAVWLGIAAVTLGMGLLSVGLLGLDGLSKYLQELPRTGRIYQDSGLNLSVWTLGFKLFPDEQAWAALVSTLIGITILLSLGAWIWRVRHHDLAYGAAIAASTIINPIAWDIYAILAILPAVQILEAVKRRGWRGRPRTATLVLAVGLLVPPLPWIHVASSLIPTMALLGVALLALSLSTPVPGRERARSPA